MSDFAATSISPPKDWQAFERKSRLLFEAVVPPTAAYANGDGRHMVRAGAREFTTWFLAALADTSAFRALIESDQNKSTDIQLDYVCCVPRLLVAQSMATFGNSTATNRQAAGGIGINSTIVNSALLQSYTAVGTTVPAITNHTSYVGTPGVGRNFAAAMKYGAGADTQTWFGTNTPPQFTSGIIGLIAN